MNYIIVTNTINRSVELVARSLKTSLRQNIAPVKVILIDQNKNSLNLPEEIENHPLFERQISSQKGVSGARNSLRIPQNVEWIFFCDDDGFPCENYSDILCKLINQNQGIEIMAGSIIREDNKQYYSLRHKKGGSLKFFRNTKNLMGSNFVIKADVFERLGRFDELFGAGSYFGSSEETDFCWKAYFNNVNMDFFPELIVYHVPPFNESIKLGFKKSFFYGVGKGALVWKWLIKNKKWKVSYELLEMITVPFIISIRGILLFNLAIVASNFAGLTGRIYGLFKGMFYYLRA